MLFLADGNGTPSQAKIIVIGPNTCPSGFTVTVAILSQDACRRSLRYTATGNTAGAYE